MPGFDRTGPEGQGSRTGRQMGKCSNNENSTSGNDYQMGQGLGRGMGREVGKAASRAAKRGTGRGLGRGLGRGTGRSTEQN
ncbi:MAG: hypothetical protein DRJ13_09690 [Bacteroidetes bacterium]|nr:MAG: hypothetical protein DRJ13_09690 [Bacteroidota bacterium]